MAARVVRDPAGGSKSLPDGSVHKGRGTRQLHDVTGKVQHARLIVAVQSARSASCRAGRAFKFIKWINSERKKQASLSGGQDSLGRGEKIPLFQGTGYTTS